MCLFSHFFINLYVCIIYLLLWQHCDMLHSHANKANLNLIEFNWERERERLPYRTPQGWDYLLHQSAIAQQKWTGNNTVKPSVYLNTRSSIKYKSSPQPKCITGICSVKIKSYMCSYKIFIYMWWYVRIYSNIGISRVVRTATFSCRYHLDWNFTILYCNFDTTVKICMLLNKVLYLVIKVKGGK